jgi:hypothetical protein
MGIVYCVIIALYWIVFITIYEVCKRNTKKQPKTTKYREKKGK